MKHLESLFNGLRTSGCDFVYEHLFIMQLIFKFMICCLSGNHTWSLLPFRELPVAARASNTILCALTALSELSHNSVSSDNTLLSRHPDSARGTLTNAQPLCQKGSAETGGSLLISRNRSKQRVCLGRPPCTNKLNMAS